MATVARVFERITAMLAFIAALMILAMSLWITGDVLARNLLGIGKPWFFDLSEYTLVWVTFLAAPWVLLQDRHVRIEILTDLLPISAQRLVGIVVSIVGMIICAILCWRTSVAAFEYFNNDVMMPRIWRIPRIWPYAVVPLSSLLLVFAFFVRLTRYITLSNPEAEFKRFAATGQATIAEPVAND